MGDHAARIYPEILDDGLHGSDPADRQTRRVWVSACKCGWVAGSGVGVATFPTRRRARHAYRVHTSPVVRQAGDSPLPQPY